jgi:hypothetical protein
MVAVPDHQFPGLCVYGNNTVNASAHLLMLQVKIIARKKSGRNDKPTNLVVRHILVG